MGAMVRAEDADLLLANGNVYTVTRKQPKAYAAFEEEDKGSIEVGKLADFTVLSRDIMKIPESEILETQNEMTVIGGEIIHSR